MMTEPFELQVIYKGHELTFAADLLDCGYVHKFQVEVNDQQVLFELDEERNYRAVVDMNLYKNDKNIDINLLKAIAAALESIVK